MKTNDLRNIMTTAWGFFRTTGQNFSACLRQAWANFRLVRLMRRGIVRFYYRKVDGSIREAWGTLRGDLIPATSGKDTRRRNDTIQAYYDTERAAWRCFKKLNLSSVEVFTPAKRL